MVELKTLKDIDGYHIEFFETTLSLPHNYDDTHGTNFATLKQEAIKWIKSRIRKCCGVKGLLSICEEHKFWMKRFNITTEDLNG